MTFSISEQQLSIILLILSFSFILFFFSFNPDSDYKFPKQFVSTVLGILLLCWELAQYLPFSALLAGYMLITAGYLSQWAALQNEFTGHNGHRNHAYLSSISAQFIDLVCIILIFLYFPVIFIQPIYDIMPLISLINTLLVFIYRRYKIKRTGNTAKFFGLCGNQSVNGTLSSLIAISCLAGSNLYLGLAGWLLGVITTIRCRGSAGVGAVVIGSSVYGFYTYPLYTGIIWGSIIASGPLWWNWSKKWFDTKKPKFFFEKIHPFFFLSTRDEIWGNAWRELFLKARNKFFGVGTFTFNYCMPLMQILKRQEEVKKNPELAKNKNLMLIIWAHSDYLQHLIECGYIGMFLLILAQGELVYIGHLDGQFMAFLVTFSLNALVNFPVRMAPDTFLMILAAKNLIF